MDGHLGNNVATGYNASEMSLRSSSSQEHMALSWGDLDLASFIRTVHNSWYQSRSTSRIRSMITPSIIPVRGLCRNSVSSGDY